MTTTSYLDQSRVLVQQTLQLAERPGLERRSIESP
jgi:hypothetical protein